MNLIIVGAAGAVQARAAPGARVRRLIDARQVLKIQDGCKSGSCRCRRAQAAPGRRANRGSIRADGSRTSDGTYAGARARRGPAAAPRPDAELHGAHRRAAGRRGPTNSGPARRLAAPERGALLEPARAALRSQRCRHGHDAGLVALAEHAHGAVGEIDVRQIEADEFGEPQPGGVEQLHDRLVARRERIVGAKCRAGAAMWSASSVFGRRFSASARALSAPGSTAQRPRASGSRRRCGAPTAAAEWCAARGRRRARRRRRRARAAWSSALQARDPARACRIRAQLEQIVPVGGDRMRAHAPLVRRCASEAIDPSASRPNSRTRRGACRLARQRVGHELADPRQEFRAHGRVKAVRVARADRQSPERALRAERASSATEPISTESLPNR